MKWKYIESILDNLKSSIYIEKSIKSGISKEKYIKQMKLFKNYLKKDIPNNLNKYKKSFEIAKKKRVETELMYHIYLKYIKDSSLEILNFSKPEEWYAEARKMKRKIIFHTGPTNSGKSYHAIERLIEKGGVYCSPLRLLATEIYEKIKDKEYSCDLLTGEYKIIEKDSKYISCTIEMLDIDKFYEIVVIDEIQMISDESRGGNWTRALLGSKSFEIHLCGEERCIEMIQKLCNITKDELEIRNYKRLTPLSVLNKNITKLSELKKGDCIITFSRKEIFYLKNFIESKTSLKTTLVYGNLPPNVRLNQAKLFNSSKEYDILLATDAIGFGLNLNISRIIFYNIYKFDGKENRLLYPQEMKQIGGRAGRYLTKYPNGYITCFNSKHLNWIKKGIEKKNENILKIGLLPNLKQIELYHYYYQDLTFSELLSQFCSQIQLNNFYFLCDMEDKIKISKYLDHSNLSIQEKFILIHTPIDIEDTFLLDHFLDFLYSHSIGQQVSLSESFYFIPKTNLELKKLELNYQLLSIYTWLSYHFQNTFYDRDFAFELKEKIEKNIHLYLLNNSKKNKLIV